MKLTDLDPHWVTFEPQGALGKPESFAQAHGVRFLCPSCFLRRAGPIGTHSLLIPFAGHSAPYPIAWQAQGTSYADLTVSPSILVHPTPITAETLPEYFEHLCRGWHGFIVNGEIRTC